MQPHCVAAAVCVWSCRPPRTLSLMVHAMLTLAVKSMAVWHDPCKSRGQSFTVKIQPKSVNLYASMYSMLNLHHNPMKVV